MLNNKTRTTLVAALLITGVSEMWAQPDAFGYTASNNVPYSYVNIGGTGTSVLAGADDGTAVLALPFSFRFYGIAWNSVCVSSNGVLSFGSCIAGDFTNLDLTSQSPPGNQPLIAPFWTDLTFGAAGTGSIYYQTAGAAPTRRFIIQWNNVGALNVPGTLNFQVILWEGTNKILFQYQNVDSTGSQVDKGGSATVGIRGASGNTNNNRLQWSYRAPVLLSGSAIQFTAPPNVAATDVSSSFRVTTSAFVLNRLQGTYNGTVVITNTSATTVARPLTIILLNLTPGVTAGNASGTMAGQGPYFLVPGTQPLAPGQSAAVPIQMTNPSNARISFVVKTYSGAF